jgi:hypothetical protein
MVIVGQAQYIEDMPDVPFQLFGALVLAEATPNSVIKNIDTTKALVAFVLFKQSTNLFYFCSKAKTSWLSSARTISQATIISLR